MVESLVITTCGMSKLKVPAPARHMYTGPYARLIRERAELLAATLPGSRVLLLSAFHGFVDLDTVIEPYNVRFGQPEAASNKFLLSQIVEMDLVDVPDVRMIGSKQYFRRVRRIWPHATEIFPPTTGIKHMIRWLQTSKVGE